MAKRTAAEYKQIRKDLREMVDNSVSNGMGRYRAITEMFEYASSLPYCDPHKWFPGFNKILAKTPTKTLSGLATLAEQHISDCREALTNLIIMAQLTDVRNRKIWVLPLRAAKYVHNYKDRYSGGDFYPYTALVIDVYLKTRNPKAWNAKECEFGEVGIDWFIDKSVAYKNIMNEFGAAALPDCFK